MTNREAPIQRAIVAYLRHVLPDAIVHHSANEGGDLFARVSA